MRNCTDLIKALGTRSERLKWATNPSGMIRWLTEIQIEAWRAGITDAINIVKNAEAQDAVMALANAIEEKEKAIK